MGNDRGRRGKGGEDRCNQRYKHMILCLYYFSLLEDLSTENVTTKKNRKINEPQIRMFCKIRGGTF